MDELENFIRSNKAQLDVNKLADADLERMISHAAKRNSSPRRIWWLAAASVMALMVWSLFDQPKDNPVQESLSDSQTVLAKFAPEMVGMEAAYQEQIKVAMSGLSKNSKLSTSYLQSFRSQLVMLDNQSKLYQIQLEANGYNSEIVQHMMYTLQLKLSVLQMMQMEIEKIENTEKLES